jgi:competence protein ComEC
LRTKSIKPPKVAPPHRLPALWLALLLAAGIQFQQWLDIPLAWLASLWLALAVALAVAASVRAGFGTAQTSGALALIIVTGSLVSLLFDQTLDIKRRFADSHGETVALQGWVCGPPRLLAGRYGSAGRLEFDLDVTAEKRSDDSAWQRAGYRLHVYLHNPGGLELFGGDRLALAAELLPTNGYANPGGFDWREYWGRRFVAGEARVRNGGYVKPLRGGPWPGVRGMAARLQAKLLELHETLYPDPQVRAVAGAILLGDRRGLDRATRNWFVRSGTIHVLVVSGLHLGFIAGIVYLLFSLVFGKGFAAAALTSAVLLVFALATGGRPPVVRAWLLVTFAMFALPAGRTRVLLNSLALAFAVLLLVNPSWLHDPGFQLSFAAVAGIGLVMPHVEARYSRRDWWSSCFWRWAFRLGAVSVAAQLTVAPLLAWHFSSFSLAAFVANPPVVALAGICVIGGFAADVVGLLWLGAGKFLAFWVALPIESMTAVARWFAGFDWAQFRVNSPGAGGVICCWAGLLCGARLVGGEYRYAGRLALTLLVWLNLAVWSPLLTSLRSRMEITFLDLGEATAPVVTFPGGGTLLADQTGRSGPGNWVAGELIAPYLYRHRGGNLDYLLLRGRGSWAWTGRILRQFHPRVVIVTSGTLPQETIVKLPGYCGRNGIELRQATAEDTLLLGEARLYLHGLDRMPVIEYEGQKILLAGESDVVLAGGTDYVVVESLESVPGFDGWRVTPFGNPAGSDKVLVTSRQGAAGFVLTGDEIRVRTEREGRLGR